METPAEGDSGSQVPAGKPPDVGFLSHGGGRGKVIPRGFWNLKGRGLCLTCHPEHMQALRAEKRVMRSPPTEGLVRVAGVCVYVHTCAHVCVQEAKHPCCCCIRLGAPPIPQCIWGHPRCLDPAPSQEALEALRGPRGPHLQGVPSSSPASPHRARRGLLWATRLEEGKHGCWSQKELSGAPSA